MTNASEGEGPTGSDKRSASTGNANERWQRQTTRSKGVMITCAIAKRSLHTLARFELSRRRQKVQDFSHVVAGNERFRERSKITLKAGNQALDTVTNTDAPARRAEMRVGKATPMLERQEMAVMMMMMMYAYGIMGIVSGEVVFSYALASRGFSIPRPDWPRRNPSTPIFLRNSREFFREFLRS